MIRSEPEGPKKVVELELFESEVSRRDIVLGRWMNPVKRGVSRVPRARARSAPDETGRMKTAWKTRMHVRCPNEDHEVRAWGVMY